ncbi:hypothetical protein EYF80_004040 [Liparis tanakae]|uniref:Uncharacterized protein n=1 Tax=Liparis tanakae TaxID=230148 RepID=A0A4Z2J826_9TELE|nr:hypothetical protein EYF80_004040 [Liparis tanakae]
MMPVPRTDRRTGAFYAHLFPKYPPCLTNLCCRRPELKVTCWLGQGLQHRTWVQLPYLPSCLVLQPVEQPLFRSVCPTLMDQNRWIPIMMDLYTLLFTLQLACALFCHFYCSFSFQTDTTDKEVGARHEIASGFVPISIARGEMREIEEAGKRAEMPLSTRFDRNAEIPVR